MRFLGSMLAVLACIKVLYITQFNPLLLFDGYALALLALMTLALLSVKYPMWQALELLALHPQRISTLALKTVRKSLFAAASIVSLLFFVAIVQGAESWQAAVPQLSVLPLPFLYAWVTGLLVYRDIQRPVIERS